MPLPTLLPPCMLLPLLGVLRAIDEAPVTEPSRSWNGDPLPPFVSSVAPLVFALVQLLLLFVAWLLGVVLAVLLPPPSE